MKTARERCGDRGESGAVATEYVLLITVISILLIGAFMLISDPANGLFTAVCNPPSPFTC